MAPVAPQEQQKIIRITIACYEIFYSLLINNSQEKVCLSISLLVRAALFAQKSFPYYKKKEDDAIVPYKS